MVRINERIKDFFYKHYIALPVVFTILVFLYFRLPYFIWMPLPGLVWDSVDYYEIVELIKNGHFFGFTWLPPGFILFAYIISLFSERILTLIITQNLIFLFSCCLAIFISAKYYKKASYLIAIAYCFIIIDDYTMALDTFVLTESLYRSSLIILTSVLIWAAHARNKISFLILGLMIFLPTILRPNGLYVLSFIPVILFFLYKNKAPLKLYVSFLTPIIAFNLLWSVNNAVYLNSFSPGYPKRGTGLSFGKSNLKAGNKVNDTGKGSWREAGQNYVARYKTFYYTLTSFARQKKDFYFENLTMRNFQYYPNRLTDPEETKLAQGRYNTSFSLRKFLAAEYLTVQNPYICNLRFFSEKNKIYNNNKWLASIYLLRKFKEMFLYNMFWIVAYIFAMFWALISFIKNNLNDKLLFIILSIGSIHLLSVFVLTILNVGNTSSSLYRYAHPTEFAIFLSLALTFYAVRQKFIRKES